MTSDDEQERKARAERLRKQIDQLKQPEGDTPPGADDEEAEAKPRPGESPREFVERRMRELDKAKKKK